jgi:hypothetical protein
LIDDYQAFVVLSNLIWIYSRYQNVKNLKEVEKEGELILATPTDQFYWTKTEKFF